MKNIIKKLFCKMKWHSFTYDTILRDTHIGKQVYYKCKWCGYEGLVDSQGNLF